jgi:hypothetical protein
MSNLSIQDIVNNTLGVKSCKTMYLGVTLPDTNPESGREVSIGDVKHGHTWAPMKALMLYPVIEENEKNATDKPPIDLSMASCWVTGFTPLRRGMPNAANMSQNSRNFLDGMSVCTTDQLLKARSDGTLAAMFSRMAWYGTKGERIIDQKLATDNDAIAKVIDRGIVSKNWDTKPINVRYMLHMHPEAEDTYDYVYLIGGSDDLIGDDLSNIPKNITLWYDQIKVLKEEVKKNNAKAKKSDSDEEHSGADPKFLWYSYTKQASDPAIKANLLAKRILRTIEGVIFIRNYLAYAKNGIGIEFADEVVGYDASTKKPVFKQVEIEKILAKYDTMYAYCKNLCFIFKDIGSGDIM